MSLGLYSALDFLGTAAQGIKEIPNGLKVAEIEYRQDICTEKLA